ncbi:MAG: DNA-3-methyladenine glycosylase I [Candidatus Aminicenantes bacterium]|nr:DNA-3-methyladenine glycosylase I [Candidatus Aminicenantes bacterium]
MPQKEKKRCPWCLSDPLYVAYHDNEWGVPLHEDHRWFEFLILEGAQAGLNWLMVLKKRENYRRAYDGFDFAKVARYGEKKIARLLSDSGLIRNRAKIAASIANAQAFLEIRTEFGSFDRYMWEFMGGKPKHNRWRRDGDIPARTPLSDAISADLRRRGFQFVGSTIVYAHMQATGMVNDHLVGCFRHGELRKIPPTLLT